MFKKVFIILTLSLFLISSAGAATISWDFENGNDHLFDLWSVFPAAAWTYDPSIAGDEAITGVGGHTGLPKRVWPGQLAGPINLMDKNPPLMRATRLKPMGPWSTTNPV